MKLKPCPFCARQPEIYEFHDRCHTVICKCGAESPKDSVSKSGAARIWNRRRLENIQLPPKKHAEIYRLINGPLMERTTNSNE